MSSQFYSRYIPPVDFNPDLEEAARPTKKRKKAKRKNPKSKSDISEPLSSQLPIEADNTDDLPSRDKHQAVLSRYGESAKAVEAPEGDAATETLPTAAQDSGTTIEFHGLEPLPQPEQVKDAPKVSAFSFLPEWLQVSTVVSSSDTVPFNDLPIDKKTVSSLQQKGYETAFAIQSAIIPMLLSGPKHYSGDLCISAATGSGKTLAYVLPMIEALRGKPVTRLRGLVVVPTRELVSQVKETLDLCGGGSGLKVGTAVGSKPLKDEQALIIQKGQRYDPKGYKVEQEKEIDEDEELMDWDFEKRFGPRDDFEILYNHVVEYTSKVDILICTPGRLVEHIQSTTGFTLEHAQWLVIDEADRLLDESFQQWIDIVIPGLEYLPPLNPIQERIANAFHTLRRRDVRKIILSATMTRDVSKLTALKLRQPRLVVLEGQQPQEGTHIGTGLGNLEAGERVELPPTLHEIGVKVLDSNDKPLYLVRILDAGPNMVLEKVPKPPASETETETESESSTSSSNVDRSPTSSPAPRRNKTANPMVTPPSNTTHGTLIFTKTNEHATRLAHLLFHLRPSLHPKIATLTKLSTKTSRKTLSAFRAHKLSILIASDRASRGLDIPNLAHVINYDMPSSLTSYVHRVGRTARAGMEGRATTLVADNEARWFWNEIARAGNVGRGVGRKVGRDNSRYVFGEGEREAYQVALEELGREAQG